MFCESIYASVSQRFLSCNGLLDYSIILKFILTLFWLDCTGFWLFLVLFKRIIVESSRNASGVLLIESVPVALYGIWDSPSKKREWKYDCAQHVCFKHFLHLQNIPSALIKMLHDFILSHSCFYNSKRLHQIFPEVAIFNRKNTFCSLFWHFV